jgi:CP family cyanate transporter-like MFS transporter
MLAAFRFCVTGGMDSSWDGGMARERMPSTTWMRIAVLYGCGVLAAAQIGKLAALAPTMQRELALGLSTMALLVALIEAGGALFATRAGRVALRVGLERSLLVAVLLLCAASVGEAFAHGAASLFAWRAVEALGYVGVVVTAPVLIAALAGPPRAPALLALWSTFVPVGLALGTWGLGWLADVSGWRAAALASGAAAGVCALAVWAGRWEGAQSIAPASGESSKPPLGRAAWCLAIAFGGFAALGVGVLALLPTVLVNKGLTVADAARWTAWASLAAVPGSLLIAAIVRWPATHRLTSAASLLASGLLIGAVFGADLPARGVGIAAVLLNMALGIFGGLAFALLPQAAGDAPRAARAYGALAQWGASGSLAGPPLLAFTAEHAGWASSAAVGFGVALVSGVIADRALRRPAG